MSDVTLEDLREADRQAKNERQPHPSPSSGDDYGPSPQPLSPRTRSPRTPSSRATQQTEPAVPKYIDHGVRRQVRLAPVDTDLNSLPKFYVECGCGGCPERVDPLADGVTTETGAFAAAFDRSDYWAVEECPDPRPMTLERAARAYYTYQTALYRRADKTSRLGDMRGDYGRYTDAERELLDDWDGETSTALLSCRLPPVEVIHSDPSGVWSGSEADDYGPSPQEESELGSGVTRDNGVVVEVLPDDADGVARRWIPPTRIADRLLDVWPRVGRKLRDHLGEFEEWQYVRLVSTTETAATPHLHVLVWVRDPEDRLSCHHVEPAIQEFLDRAPTARPEDHPVAPGESDAAVVSTEPAKMADIPDERLIEFYRKSRGDPYDPDSSDEWLPTNTRAMAYLLKQRPHWALKQIHEGPSTFPEERTTLEGAAIAQASGRKWIDSSNGFDTTTD